MSDQKKINYKCWLNKEVNKIPEKNQQLMPKQLRHLLAPSAYHSKKCIEYPKLGERIIQSYDNSAKWP